MGVASGPEKFSWEVGNYGNTVIIYNKICLCGIFFHAGRPEKNEFYLCGLIKRKRTC